MAQHVPIINREGSKFDEWKVYFYTIQSEMRGEY